MGNKHRERKTRAGFRLGDPLPDLTACDSDGNPFKLSQLKGHCLVACLAALRDHHIHKTLAHPELNAYVNPFTLEERLTHIKKAE